MHKKKTQEDYPKKNSYTLNVQPVTRGLKTFVSVQQSGRSPGLEIIASAIFPVSQ